MINVSFTNLLTNLDPTEAWSFQHFVVLQSVYDTLIRTDDAGTVVSGIAKKWDYDEKLKRYNFELRSDAKFSDGSPITSVDVAMSLSRHFSPGSNSVVKPYLEQVIISQPKYAANETLKAIKTHGNHKLSISVRGFYPPFLNVLSMPGFSITKSGTVFSKTSISSGAMVASLIENNEIRLTPNTFYCGERPKTVAFCLSEKKNISEIHKSLQNDTLDVAFGVPFSESEINKKIRNVKLIETGSLVVVHLYVNSESKIFSNLKNRESLLASINEVKANHKSFSKFQTPLYSYIPPGVLPNKYYNRLPRQLNSSVFKGDPEALKSLRIYILDSYFSTEFTDELNEKLTKKGLHKNVIRIDAKKMNALIDSKEYDAISIPYMGNYSDPDGFLELTGRTGPFPSTFFEKGTLSEKLNKYRFSSDRAKRAEGYTHELTQFEDDLYALPLFKINLPLLHRLGIHVPDTNYKYEAELRKIFWEIN